MSQICAPARQHDHRRLAYPDAGQPASAVSGVGGVTVPFGAEQGERADGCGFGGGVAWGVEGGEGVGEPGPHRSGGRLLGLVQLCEERGGEGEAADVGVVGADDDDLGVGPGRS